MTPTTYTARVVRYDEDATEVTVKVGWSSVWRHEAMTAAPVLVVAGLPSGCVIVPAVSDVAPDPAVDRGEIVATIVRPDKSPAESALYDFLDALVLAKQNDDVMSVVDAMLATYAEGQINAEVDVPPDPTAPDPLLREAIDSFKAPVSSVQPQDEPTSRWIVNRTRIAWAYDKPVGYSATGLTHIRSYFHPDQLSNLDEDQREAAYAVLVALVEGASQPQPDTPDLTDSSSGVSLIAAERRRQVETKGWTAEHDAEHANGALVAAARCYLSRNSAGWPWDIRWWKPSTDSVRNLVKAGALIAAELDRRRAVTEGDR